MTIDVFSQSDVVRHGMQSNNSIMFHKVHKVYQPHPALKEFVNNIMIQKVELDPSQPLLVFLMPPIQEQCLFFYPHDPVQIEYTPSHKIVQLHKSTLLARRVKLINVIMGYNHLVVKVGFQPGGLYRLLGIPMNEFNADEGFESDYLVDKEICFIVQQLNEAGSFEHIAAILQKCKSKNCKRIKYVAYYY